MWGWLSSLPYNCWSVRLIWKHCSDSHKCWSIFKELFKDQRWGSGFSYFVCVSHEDFAFFVSELPPLTWSLFHHISSSHWVSQAMCVAPQTPSLWLNLKYALSHPCSFLVHTNNTLYTHLHHTPFFVLHFVMWQKNTAVQHLLCLVAFHIPPLVKSNIYPMAWLFSFHFAFKKEW